MYICRERERERYVCVCIYIYIYARTKTLGQRSFQKHQIRGGRGVPAAVLQGSYEECVVTIIMSLLSLCMLLQIVT